MRLLRFTLCILAMGLSVHPARAFLGEPVTAQNGMVVTSQKIASDVGLDILKQGGNAIDAAVAIGYAMAVVHPCCGNLGGGGFATLHLADGRDVFLNFRERAPFAATETMYLDDKGEVIKGASLKGYLSVAVPGTVMGLDTLLKSYGTLPRETVMAPAIKLAEEGFVLDQGDIDILARGTESFAAEPTVAAIFLKDGKPFQAGDRLIQSQLAATLKTISSGGADAFYNGPLANKIADAIHDGGGLISPNDLASYRVSEDPPVRCSYRGYEIISAPPPSSGGTTICLILNILEDYPLKDLGWQSAQAVHLMVEAMRHAFVDRNFLLGDPEFVNNPLNKLLSKDYAAEIRSKINADKASTSEEVQPGVAPHEGTQTTHFSVVDSKGNAVAITYTINAYFGAKVMAGDTGFFLNDEMDDFTIKPGVANLFGLVQGKANAIAPGKRPLSSMSPTIVKKDGKVFMVLGSPGGSRIITIVTQAILNVIDHGMTVQEAVNAPRIHHQWLPDTVAAEPFALSPDTKAKLEGMGHKIAEQSEWGAAEAILVGPAVAPEDTTETSGNDAMAKRRPVPGLLYGGHDARRPAGGVSAY